ncbi:hypothetical protein GN958_ATG19797 [Phytophthora infestans]|uniref:Uncharacterized protein n=1 Tax=Phytophthora infestans TaxID=4787 RepID=A0A8S9TSR2_PHYIN|nr:hypothetical protein GN958_ATG19797 [Phytophthora infestans]
MTKSSKKSGTTPTVEDQHRSRLDDEDRTADDAILLHFMNELWRRLRAVLATNSHSVGLDALDRQVLRPFANDTFQAPLVSAVVFLPSPESISDGQVRAHAVFQAPVTQTRSCSRTPLKPPQLRNSWFGDRPAKHTSGASDDSKSPAQEDLGVLFKRHRRRYGQVIASTLDSFEVDSSGYRSIPELLETSQAIDPTRPKNLRRSDKALARVALNVSGRKPPKESWVGNRNRGPWKKLLSDRSLRVTQAEVATLTAGKPVIVHNARPFQTSEQEDDDSDFEENGELTALQPSPPVKYQPSRSPTKHLAYYLGLSSDEEAQEQEEGHPGNEHDDEEIN